MMFTLFEEIEIFFFQKFYRELYHRSKYQETGVMVHFPFIDQQTVEKSQYLFYKRDKKRPLQFSKYIEFP